MATFTSKGWAVRNEAEIFVKTVSSTARAAIINWLITEAHIMVLAGTPDDEIERMFAQRHGNAKVVPVTIQATN